MNNTIKINGTEYPFNFGLNATREFVEETKINSLNLNLAIVQRLDYTFLAIYLGIKNGYRKEGKRFLYTIEQVVDLFEEDPNAIEGAIKVMAEQLMMVDSKINKKNKESKNVKAPKQN